MIIRSRRKIDSLMQRLLGRTPPNSKTDTSVIYSQEAFLFELAKETARANRNDAKREYALISICFGGTQLKQEIFDEFVIDIRQRLRIYDVLGWFRDELSLLLPETAREGALIVANEITKIGASRNLVVDTDVRIYPWNDELISVCEVLHREPDDEDEGDNRESGLVVKHTESGSESTEMVSAQIAAGLEESSTNRFSAIEQRANMIGFTNSIATPRWKRALDIFGAGLGLLLLSPLFVAAAIAIKLNSRGPVLFKQTREGIDGKHFEIWKFRTMRFDAEVLKEELLHRNERDGPAFKIKDDPRVTMTGRYLRQTCVDELPQLLNVLRGEMSLVGPRPLPVNESVACEPWQRHRLSVLPGVTGIWQVDGSRETRFVDWMRMDREYIRRRSFLYDLKLIIRTAAHALLHRGSV